jgi:ferritin-like metal-binding protein YciE
LDELADAYDAEKQLLKALPKMAKAAQNEQLKDGFEEHLEQTQQHVERLEQVFEIFGQPAKGKKCKAMQGLIEEGKELIEEDEGDAALICAAQKVEHYEIAAYGSMCSWAKLLGEDEAADILGETLEEEKETDEKLNELAESTLSTFDEAVLALPTNFRSEFLMQARQLEAQLLTIYRLVAISVRDEDDLDEVANMWGAMVAICDKFADRLGRLKAAYPDCGADIFYDHILDIRNKCKRLEQLHA